MSERYEIVHGDCLEVLRTLPDACVDAVVTDPPAGVAFMGKTWDSDKGGRDAWVAWLADVMRECLRVLKPGGHALVWSLPRTSHWTAWAVESAGFFVVDKIGHCFGNGFPKSLDISKAIDKHYGAARAVVGERAVTREWKYDGKGGNDAVAGGGHKSEHLIPVTASATSEAAAWDGWGTALKPSREDWILARKPLAGTYAANILEHGVGALNITACRVGTTDDIEQTCKYAPGPCQGHANARLGKTFHRLLGGPRLGRCGIFAHSGSGKPQDVDAYVAADKVVAGRWPPNTLLSHAPGCERVGTLEEKPVTHGRGVSGAAAGGGQVYGTRTGADTLDTAPLPTGVYRCAPGCPVAELDRQSGAGKSRRGKPRKSAGPGDGYGMTHTGAEYDDAGGASRFFPTFEAEEHRLDCYPNDCAIECAHYAPPLFRYQAKPSRRERDAGCEHLEPKSAGEATDREEGTDGLNSPRAGAGRTGGARNHHPTVKAIELMRWLVRLVAPRGALVLDPFAGSGTTGCAAVLEGCRFLGVELTAEYLPILEARLAHAERCLEEGREFSGRANPKTSRRRKGPPSVPITRDVDLKPGDAVEFKCDECGERYDVEAYDPRALVLCPDCAQVRAMRLRSLAGVVTLAGGG